MNEELISLYFSLFYSLFYLLSGWFIVYWLPSKYLRYRKKIKSVDYEFIELKKRHIINEPSITNREGNYQDNLEVFFNILLREGAEGLTDSADALALACTISTEAVTQDNADWAKEAMLRAWFEHANTGGVVARSRVRMDFPVFSRKLVLWSKFSN